MFRKFTADNLNRMQVRVPNSYDVHTEGFATPATLGQTIP